MNGSHLSVVSPVYMADGCIPELCDRLKSALATITDAYEIILVDDRSTDASWTAIEAEAAKDSRVRGIRLARNFGQHLAISAGLDRANGDYVFVMDCDLQDPPEAIPALYSKALEGYEIVVASFEQRVESKLRQLISRAFWAVLSRVSGVPFDHRTGNFRIMSKRVVESFREYREQLRLLGGITNLMGFTTSTLPVKREARFSGETSYSLKKKIGAAINIAIAYSDKPLKFAAASGFLIAGLSGIVGIIIFVIALFGIVEVPGWAGVMVSVYILGGVILGNLGVIGYYLGKTFEEAKRRPLYVVESETYGL